MSANAEPSVPEGVEAPGELYCYMCEDGGRIIDCSLCPNACCYDVIGEKPANPTEEPEACVSIPESMANNDVVPFPCPACVAIHRPRTIGYFVNRGSRTTMRVASKTSVALVVYHLRSLADEARTLAEQLLSALQVFYVNVAWQTRLIHHAIKPEEAEEFFKELPRDAPYHLAVVFMTEGDPRGGWWHTSLHRNQPDSRVNEDKFLESCLRNLHGFGRKAVTARLFGIACGLNLGVPVAMQRIKEYLTTTPFISMVLPTSCALLVHEWARILPELFVNLYYFGVGLENSVLRIWGKSTGVRKHTGILLMERPGRGYSFNVKKYMHSPTSSRPYGVELPDVTTICGCRSDAKWRYKTEIQNRLEVVFVFRSTCCGVELQVAIHPTHRRRIKMYDTTMTEEFWHYATESFLFTERENVAMRIFPPDPHGPPRKPFLQRLWTMSGKRNEKRI
ncbi:hypothetical protein FRC09_009791 [Ceratobasidium sp. 395]|nr:hypothetical protein FRC09_009791 [Ceratobasidium sp. 395]